MARISIPTILIGFAITLLTATASLASQAPDSGFMTKAAQAGIMEVELGSYAATHGSYAPLRAFGKQMVRDHSKANAELLQIAESQGAKLPTTPSFTQQTDQIIVKSQKGRSFDHHYIDQMIKDHSAAIKLFQQEIDSGQNDRDKDFAKRTLPTIKMHAQMAQSVKANLP